MVMYPNDAKKVDLLLIKTETYMVIYATPVIHG